MECETKKRIPECEGFGTKIVVASSSNQQAVSFYCAVRIGTNFEVALVAKAGK